MIDLETLGTKAGDVILSISAIHFNIYTGEIIKEFHANIDRSRSVIDGFNVCPDTVAWWELQSEESRQLLLKDVQDPFFVMVSFASWIESISENSDGLNVWGNSPTLDISLTRSYFSRYDIDCPFGYWEERDYRTIRGIFIDGLIKGFDESKIRPEFTGIKHYGIDDCKYQLLILTYMINFLANGK